MLQVRQLVRLRSRPRARNCGFLSTVSQRKDYHSSSSTHQQQQSQEQPQSSAPLFDKVLIANRGEIACRVVRTCRTLGIPTVALYSPADATALHATLADEAYPIGYGSAPSESYLLQDEVLEIATQSGATAIHPGYGFLSENADFCQKVHTETNGKVTFVGPPASAITAMGSKSKSKELMEAAGVTTAPGFYGDTPEEQEPGFLLDQAVTQVGFPLLIKAVMGGGGKGMRVVWSESDFLASLEACKREARGAFGNDVVLLEKYLVNPRHVEVQVVADAHGNVVSLHERDCSLQRRHQKIIEEAPASDLSQELRQRLGRMGCKAAQAVGYVNAGTVEFLLDSHGDTQDPNFYFCEMNTRLQVEHPITELITGIDLVEWQLRVAAGEVLPIQDPSEIPCRGHALEARIYAEKPGDGNFLPASGTVWHHDPPAPSNAVGVPNPTTTASQDGMIRVDTGIQSGQAVGVDYDPMICKLIVHDPTSRAKALDKLVEALKNYRIAGVPTNIDFLIRCANHPTFRTQGATHTGFLDDHLHQVLPPLQPTVPAQAIAMAVVATRMVLEGRVGITGQLQDARRTQSSPWSSLEGSWRTFGNPRERMTLADGTLVDCTSLRDGSYKITVTAPLEENENKDENKKATTTVHVAGTLSADHQMTVVVNGSEHHSLVVALRPVEGDFQVCLWPQSAAWRNQGHYFWEVTLPNPRVPRSADLQDGATLKGGQIIQAPMPGKISKICCAVGDVLEAGDTVVVMEAMKMEHTVQTTTPGVVQSIHATEGDVVADQTTLVVVGAEGDDSDGSDKEEEAV